MTQNLKDLTVADKIWRGKFNVESWETFITKNCINFVHSRLKYPVLGGLFFLKLLENLWLSCIICEDFGFDGLSLFFCQDFTIILANKLKIFLGFLDKIGEKNLIFWLEMRNLRDSGQTSKKRYELYEIINLF